MKTEPTQAKEWVRHRKGKYYFGKVVNIIEAEAGCDIAFREGQSNPKIKQLEWARNGTIWHVNQYNPIGYTACITEWNLGKKDYSVRLGLNDSNNSTKFFNSLDEAKDFVQQDFEKRVKECLITE